MKYNDYEAAFSQARLSRYLNACAGDKNKALILYRHNLKLCQKFYGVLGLFEVVFRNAVNEHYKRHFGDEDWIKHIGFKQCVLVRGSEQDVWEGD